MSLNSFIFCTFANLKLSCGDKKICIFSSQQISNTKPPACKDTLSGSPIKSHFKRTHQTTETRIDDDAMAATRMVLVVERERQRLDTFLRIFARGIDRGWRSDALEGLPPSVGGLYC